MQASTTVITADNAGPAHLVSVPVLLPIRVPAGVWVFHMDMGDTTIRTTHPGPGIPSLPGTIPTAGINFITDDITGIRPIMVLAGVAHHFMDRIIL